METASSASKIMKPVVRMVGIQNRFLVRLPVVGKKIVEGSGRAIGKLAPRFTFLGFKKEPSYENALHNWETFLALISAEYEKETRGPQENVYTFLKCPAGFCSSEHADACDGTMVLDHTLVATSGAQLRVDKRIPVDGICVESVVPAPTGKPEYGRNRV
jgi:hypothetical protein